MRKQPSQRDPASAKNGGPSRQSEITHGSTTATEPGAMRSQKNDPTTGARGNLMPGSDPAPRAKGTLTTIALHVRRTVYGVDGSDRRRPNSPRLTPPMTAKSTERRMVTPKKWPSLVVAFTRGREQYAQGPARYCRSERSVRAPAIAERNGVVPTGADRARCDDARAHAGYICTTPM